MSQDTKKPSEASSPGTKSTRRDVLKRLVIGLGAAALIQPNGGVLGFAQDSEKKKKKTKSSKKKKKKSSKKPS
jgi:hypothetical protein